jgi:hypothetical protein
MVVMEPTEEVSDQVTGETKTSRVKVVGLIDWELSGWYPEYWEHTKALHTVWPGDPMEDWWAYVPKYAIGQ